MKFRGVTGKLTPYYCFQRAAESLNGEFNNGQRVEIAREWRQLGETIAAENNR